MRAAALALLLFSASCPASSQGGAATAQAAAAPAVVGVVTPAVPAKRVRVYVTDSSSWQVSGGSGGTYGAFGGGVSGGASPQTAEVIKTIGQRCPELLVNSKVELSDYVIRLDHEGGKGLLRKKDKVAVFQQRTGDSIYSASTLSVGGSVQGACEAIQKDWTTYSAAEAAIPAGAGPGGPAGSAALAGGPGAVATAPAGAAPPVMAGLVVESNVPGADIEIDGNFVGNTPSTLSVMPGQHTVVVKKKGYEDWTRAMNVSGNAVHLNAELASKP